jgi:hypothetical protein
MNKLTVLGLTVLGVLGISGLAFADGVDLLAGAATAPAGDMQATFLSAFTALTPIVVIVAAGMLVWKMFHRAK